MPPCWVSSCYSLLLSLLVLSQGTMARVHMLYWNASNPLLLTGSRGLLVNTNLDQQQYDQVYCCVQSSYM
jgi:hypothetical protein